MAKGIESPGKKPVKRAVKKISRPSKPGNGSGRVEHIHIRAYEIYQERLRNNQPGDMISDWVQAEREVDRGVPGAKSRK